MSASLQLYDCDALSASLQFYDRNAFASLHGCSAHGSSNKGLENIALIGLDEVGRGPLAGPVIAAAFYYYPFRSAPSFFADINDSKKLSLKKREAIAQALIDETTNSYFAYGAASVHEIDAINILQASKLAMRRALSHLTFHKKGHLILIDGNQKISNDSNHLCVVKGDQKSLAIAASSILAKTLRDRLMMKLGDRYTAYGFDKNAGYGVKKHLAAMQAFGITPHHRKSFAPCQKAQQV